MRWYEVNAVISKHLFGSWNRSLHISWFKIYMVLLGIKIIDLQSNLAQLALFEMAVNEIYQLLQWEVVYEFIIRLLDIKKKIKWKRSMVSKTFISANSNWNYLAIFYIKIPLTQFVLCKKLSLYLWFVGMLHTTVWEVNYDYEARY